MIVMFGRIVPAGVALLAQASSPANPITSLLVPMVAIAAVFYFLMIVPAQRRQKKVNEMLKNLKNGDKVVTSGGIYGTIVGLEGDAVQLRIADQVKIKVSRSAIAGLQLESKES
jgi:preprotein translocase subunit YajC